MRSINSTSHRSLAGVCGLAIMLVAAPSALAQRADRPLPSDSTILALLRQRVDAGLSAGVVVGLVDLNGSTRTVAYGMGAGGAPLDAHSIFELGSLTKTFTATALASMVLDGSVRLDQPVAALLSPGTVVPSRGGRAITLLDLATQHSGLPRLPQNLVPRDTANPYADYTGARLLDFLAHYQLTRDPGAAFEYSNLGVGLLGYALAARAGTSYERMVTERVLKPLSMNETGVALTPAMRAHLAPGHDARGHVVPNWDFDALAGAGAIRSSAHDMLLYLRAQLGAAPPSLAPTIAMTHVVHVDAGQPNLSIALAWLRAVTPAGDTVYLHDGQTGGYASFMAFDPARHVGVVILSNSGVPVDALVLQLLNGSTAVAAPSAPAQQHAVPTAVMDRLVGSYALAPTFVMKITREGDHLVVQATGQPAFPLEAESDTQYVLRVANARLEFDTDAQGNGTAVVLVQNGMRQRAVRQP